MTILRRLYVGRSVLRKKSPSPAGALLRGMIAGAAGALVQSLFFRATVKLAPTPTPLPPGLQNPEPEAKEETALQTGARRLVTGMMKRELSPAEKERASALAHVGFGALWGGLYGLLRESLPALPASLFGLGVWMASDNLILPAFKLSAWPQHYSLKEHHYAMHAHVVYGVATAGTYAVLRDLGAVPLAALPAVVALQARSWLSRTPPGRLIERRRSMPQRFATQWINRVVHA